MRSGVFRKLSLVALLCGFAIFSVKQSEAQSGHWEIGDYTVTMPPVAETTPATALGSNGVTYTLSPPTAYALILQNGVSGDASIYGKREAQWVTDG